MQITKKGNKIKGKDKSEATAKGTHILTLCDARSEKSQYLSRRLEDVRLKREFLIKTEAEKQKLRKGLNELYDEYKFYLSQLHKQFKTKEIVVENITVTIGRSVLAQRLGGDTTYTGTVNYTALGTNNTPAVVGDATLGTETYRKALSSGTNVNNICHLETFFTATEITGTFEEYGMFINGAAGADTGQLFNRFLSTITKSALETLNVKSVVSFLDS